MNRLKETLEYLNARLWLRMNRKPLGKMGVYASTVVLWVMIGMMVSAVASLLAALLAGEANLPAAWVVLLGMGLYTLWLVGITVSLARSNGSIDALHERHKQRWQERRDKEEAVVCRRKGLSV